MARTGNGAPSPHLRTAVLVVIVGIWAASVVAQMFSPAYNPPTGINELMTAVVMYLLAKHQQGGRSEAPDDEDQ